MSAKPKLKRPRYVLVIEDNASHAELITEALDRNFAPVIVHTVDNFEDGCDFASKSNYDLILTAGVIRNEPVTGVLHRLADQPVIVISGRGDERLAAEIIKKGAVEYLVKTRETLEHLPGILEKHLSSKRSVPKGRKERPSSGGERLATPAAIIREVDRLTQQALGLADPRRKKHGGGAFPQDIEQLDKLLGQIKHLREMASKLLPK